MQFPSKVHHPQPKCEQRCKQSAVGDLWGFNEVRARQNMSKSPKSHTWSHISLQKLNINIVFPSKIFSVVHLHFSFGQFYFFECPCPNIQIWANFPKNVGSDPYFDFFHICVWFEKVKMIIIQMPETKEIPIKKSSLSKFTFTRCFYWPQIFDKYDTNNIFSFSKYFPPSLLRFSKFLK